MRLIANALNTSRRLILAASRDFHPPLSLSHPDGVSTEWRGSLLSPRVEVSDRGNNKPAYYFAG